MPPCVTTSVVAVAAVVVTGGVVVVVVVVASPSLTTYASTPPRQPIRTRSPTLNGTLGELGPIVQVSGPTVIEVALSALIGSRAPAGAGVVVVVAVVVVGGGGVRLSTSTMSAPFAQPMTTWSSTL